MKNKFRRFMACLLVIMLMSSDIAVLAEEVIKTLTLPAALQIIEEEAFYSNTSIEKVVVPDGTTEIRSRAFADSSLTELILPDSLTFIAEDAFEGCGEFALTVSENCYAYNWCVEHNLITNDLLDDKFEFTVQSDGTVSILKYIGNEENVIVPEFIKQYRVTEIANFAFYNNSVMKSIRIPDGISAIGSYCFFGCSNLEAIEIPQSVVSIGKAAFAYCSSISTISIPERVKEIPAYCFQECSKLINIQVHAGLQSIGNYAFKNCNRLENIPLAENLERIGYGAFENCSNMGKDLEFVLPDRLIVIDQRAFCNCTSLNGALIIPQSVEMIGAEAFKNCCGFVGDLTIQNCNAIIEKKVFEGCTGIERKSIFAFSQLTADTCKVTGFNGVSIYDKKNMYSINIPKYSPEGLKVTQIGSSAFRGLYLMTATDVYTYAISIPEGVTHIGDCAFQDAFLDSVELPSTLEYIGESAFRNVQYLSYINIPDGANLDVYSFASSTISYVELPNDLKTIPPYCFTGCSYLYSLDLPDGLTTIGHAALPGLTRLTIPASVTNIATTPSFYDADEVYGYKGTAAEKYPCKKFYDLNEIQYNYSVNIIVKDEDDQPIVDAEVELRNFDEKVIARGTTDEKGSCALVCIRDSEYYTVHVEKEGIYFPNNGNDLYWTTIGTSDEIQIKGVNENRFSISGKIVDENMIGIADVEVKLWLDSFSSKPPIRVVSNEEGIWMYEEAISNHEYFIVFDKPEYQFETSSVLIAVGEENTCINDVVGKKLFSDLTSISGKIVTTAGLGIEGISISLTHSTTGAYIDSATTDESGEWFCHAESGVYDLIIHFSAEGYQFNDNDIVVSSLRDVTLDSVIAIIEDNNGDKVSFTVNTPAVLVGDEAHFSVVAEEYEWVRLIVDGIAYEKYPVFAGAAEVYRIFSMAGNRSVQFQGCTGDTWGALSEAQTIEITSKGTLAVPEFSVSEEHTLGIPLTIEWTEVENAERYTVYLYRNGSSYVIDVIEADSDLICIIDATYFQQKGQYGVEVIASGYEYSQNSCDALFDVVAPTMSLIIETPLPSSDDVAYVAGDTFYIKVLNPDQQYVQIRITQPNGDYWYYSEGNTLSDATIEAQYVCEKSGKYIIEAFGYVGTTTILPEYSIKNARVDITVTPSQITDVCVGNGYGNQLISGTAYIHAKTNNAVQYVEVYEGETLLTTLTYEDHCTEVNYVRTFTSSIPKATEGKHTIRFEAYDSEGNMAKRSFTYYAVTDSALSETQYPVANGLILLKYPDLTDARKTLYVSDALTVYGTYGELYYVKSGDVYGYVSPDDVFKYSPDDRAAIGLEITSPINLVDYLEMNSASISSHKIELKWSISSLPEDAYVMAGLVKQGENEQDYLMRSSTVYYIPYSNTNLSEADCWYNAVVAVYSKDDKLITRAFESIYIYGSYDLYKLYSDPDDFDLAFRISPKKYNKVLLDESAVMAYKAYTEAHCIARLEYLGFKDIKTYNYSRNYTNGYHAGHSVGFALGWKDVLDETGEITRLYAVMLRGTSTIDEWISNFTIETGTYPYGFNTAANDVYKVLSNYMLEFREEGNDIRESKVWLTGHSRAAAVSNLLAVVYLRSTLGLAPENIYAYGFATPNCVKKSASNTTVHIWNYVLGGDLIPYVPLELWNYTKYGDTVVIKNGSSGMNLTSSSSELALKLYYLAETPQEFMDNIYPKIYEALKYGGTVNWAALLPEIGIGATLMASSGFNPLYVDPTHKMENYLGYIYDIVDNSGD